MSAIMTVEMYFRNLFFHPVKYISSFIFVSEFSKKKHIEHDKRFAATNNKVMYNFSNSDVSLNVISGIDTFDSYFLYYGRLSHEKGVKTLIKAFALHKDKKLKIVGTGPLEEQLKQLCSELKLNNIEFLGYKVGAELYKIIQNAKYVCVPSECYENNPMTIIESYTLCVPVIGAAIGGITEIVLDMHTGFLFKAGDIFSLSENIGKSDQICKTEYSKMKLEAKKFAEDYFNVDKYYNSLIDFYNKTIQK